jgi:hypothetical protein
VRPVVDDCAPTTIDVLHARTRMRILAGLATFIAGTALACVIAYWGWQLFGPAVARIPTSGPANPAATLIAANLFSGSGGPSSTSVAAGDAVLGGDTRLLGIIAEQDQRGYALFRLPSGPKLVAQGQEIASGATLVSVQPDAVTIRDGAGERRFVLRSPTTTPVPVAGAAGAPSAPRPAATAARATVAATCGPPTGFRGTVVRLNTELLGGIGADSVQWRALLASTPGGLVVREANGFGAMLGLKAGDRIAQANGIALSVPEDVSTAIVRPLLANQGVRLIGSRGGTTQEMWLANVACAG